MRVADSIWRKGGQKRRTGVVDVHNRPASCCIFNSGIMYTPDGSWAIACLHEAETFSELVSLLLD